MPDTIQHGPTGYLLPSFTARRAPEQDGARTRHPVAVVGGGLTGLTAACDLALRGVPVVLLDDDNTVGVRGASSRGVCYAQRSLEIFERFGIYDRIRDKGVTWSVGRVLADADELYSFDLAASAAGRQPPFINIQQFYVEWYLVDRLSALSAAELRWMHRVTAARLVDGHVELDVRAPDGAYVLHADWVIDASGVASTVRAALGVTPRAAPGTDRWCISDVRFGKPVPMERWTWVEASFNEGRAVWQHPMADGVWRLDCQMAPGCDPDEISRPETVMARLHACLGAETEVELVWVGPWAYRTHLLDDFRHGRVFFAGDAAHVFSPFGARGGNSGIQDAENLAWKLAAVIGGETAGTGAERLLDSYSTERRAAAAHNTLTTDRTNRFLSPRSAFERALRGTVLQLARRHAFARALMNMGRMSVAYSYEASPLSTGGGDVFPNLELRLADRESTSVAALLRGPGIRFLVLHGSGTRPAAGLPGCAAGLAAGEPVGDLPVLGGEQLALFVRPREVVVVRPDQHVAARLDDPAASVIVQAVRRALGDYFPDPMKRDTATTSHCEARRAEAIPSQSRTMRGIASSLRSSQ